MLPLVIPGWMKSAIVGGASGATAFATAVGPEGITVTTRTMDLAMVMATGRASACISVAADIAVMAAAASTVVVASTEAAMAEGTEVATGEATAVVTDIG